MNVRKWLHLIQNDPFLNVPSCIKNLQSTFIIFFPLKWFLVSNNLVGIVCLYSLIFKAFTYFLKDPIELSDSGYLDLTRFWLLGNLSIDCCLFPNFLLKKAAQHNKVLVMDYLWKNTWSDPRLRSRLFRSVLLKLAIDPKLC